jgi:iron complex outermembrane receptor protein
MLMSLSTFAQGVLDDTIQLKEVVITGTKTEVSRNNIPLSISVISNADIENSNESAVLPIISEQVPGVFVTERGITGFGVSNGAAGQISIRGIGGSPNTQVLMLLDGHPQYMGIMGHPLPDSYVASDVDRIEIIRGPASILYGSGAMGGVINIITKKQKSDGYSLNANLSYGSYNTQKYMGSVGYRKGKFSIFTSYNHDYTDGHRTNSSFKIDNGYIKATYDITDKVSAMADFNIAKFYTSDPGPMGVTDSVYINQEHWIDILRGKASLSIENNYNKFNGAIKIFHNFGEHVLYDGFHSNDINSGLMFYQTTSLFKGNSCTFGIDYNMFGGIAENTEAMMGNGIVFGDTTLTETGVYLVYQQNIKEKLILNAGIRSEYHSVYGNEWIPQGGLSYNMTDNATLKAIVSKGFRSPTIRELYLWAPANEDLQPERLMNYEFSYLQRLNSKINFELTAFHNEGSNLIKTVFDGGIPRNMNTGAFSNSGLEFLTHIRVNKSLHFHLNYSYLYMETLIIASPEHQAYFSVRYKWKNFTVSTNVQSINGLYTSVATDNIQKENYLLLNAKLRYDINDFINIYISANNLLNTEYEINYQYPMPGINFFGGLNIHFNKKK